VNGRAPSGRSVYWLTWEGYADESPLPGTPLRMAVVAAPPGAATPDTVQLARHHFEQNVLEVFGRLQDNWAWDTAIFDRKIAALPPSALADSLFPDRRALQPPFREGRRSSTRRAPGSTAATRRGPERDNPAGRTPRISLAGGRPSRGGAAALWQKPDRSPSSSSIPSTCCH
jgi:hypothetical protein